MLWSNVIDVLRGSLFVLAHWCGGSLGAAIIVEAVVLRIALLPLTLPAARRRLARERKLRALAPELQQIKLRHAGNPRAVLQATERVHAANGLSPLDGRGLMDSFVQLPPAAALYGAIRGAAGAGRAPFLWLRDLAAPDRAIAVLAALVVAAAAHIATPQTDGASTAQQVLPLVISGAVTFAILVHLSSGVALYSVTNSIIGALERAVVIRSTERAAS